MRRAGWLAVFGLFPLVCSVAGVERVFASGREVEPSRRPATPTAQPPHRLWFVEAGAADDPAARFRSRGRGYRLLLAPDRATLKLNRTAGAGEKHVDLTLAGSHRDASIEGLDPLPARVYDASMSASGALVGRSTFGRVKYSGVYPGIDLVYYGNDEQLEFDFLVAAHADPSRIRLDVSGAAAVTIAGDGDLTLTVEGKTVRVKKPLVYQEIDGRRVDVAARYLKAGASSVRFELGAYDRTRAVVIDPVVLFATYFGGSALEQPRMLRVNDFGEVYLFSSIRVDAVDRAGNSASATTTVLVPLLRR